jgi:hypothetical protein
MVRTHAHRAQDFGGSPGQGCKAPSPGVASAGQVTYSHEALNAQADQAGSLSTRRRMTNSWIKQHGPWVIETICRHRGEFASSMQRAARAVKERREVESTKLSRRRPL